MNLSGDLLGDFAGDVGSSMFDKLPRGLRIGLFIGCATFSKSPLAGLVVAGPKFMEENKLLMSTGDAGGATGN